MSEDRKGFLTPVQEEQIDELIDLNGIAETLDGPAIRLADNQGLERLKAQLDEKYPGAKEIVYEIIDAIFKALPSG